MSLVRCRARGCPHHVREGLKRGYYATGVDGQKLADGEYCWRCRARHARNDRRAKREYQRAQAEGESNNG